MKLDDIKGVLDSLKANPMAIWGLVFASLGTIGTVTYNGITYYNEIKGIATGYSDTESAAFSAERKVKALEEKVQEQREVTMKLQERLAEALMSAREAKIVSESVQKELRAGLAAQKVELESTANSLKTEMGVLKKATTNRLGN